MFQESKGVNITVYLVQSAFLQVVQAKKGDCSTERVISSRRRLSDNRNDFLKSFGI